MLITQSWDTPHSLCSASKPGNVQWWSCKPESKYIIKDKNSLLNSDKLESEYLVWAPSFNTAWTLSDKLSDISLSSLQE